MLWKRNIFHQNTISRSPARSLVTIVTTNVHYYKLILSQNISSNVGQHQVAGQIVIQNMPTT